MARLTRKEVRELSPGKILTIDCRTGAETVAAYQTAVQMRKEMEEQQAGKRLQISSSFKTNTVTIRCEEAPAR